MKRVRSTFSKYQAKDDMNHHGSGMKKYVIFALLCLFFLILWSVPLFAAAPANSCVMCHTNESLMKSMHKPPSLPVSTGEG